MSKECSNCYKKYDDSVIVCTNCGHTDFIIEETLPVLKTEVSSCSWVIKCPISKKVYEVDNENSRIEACSCCEDNVDKTQIKHEHPFRINQHKSSHEEHKFDEQSNVTINTGIDTLSLTTPPKKKSILIMTEEKTGRKIVIKGEELNNGSGIIGREGTIATDFFSSSDTYVSRNHCKITYDKDIYKIEHLPNALNPTKLDRVLLSKGVPMILHETACLEIADKRFIVSFIENNDENGEEVKNAG